MLVFDGTANRESTNSTKNYFRFNSYLTFNGVWTKPEVGHGVDYRLPSGLPYGLPVVIFLITSERVERVAGIKLLTRFSTSEGTKLWKSNILQHSALKHHISCCLRRHIPRQVINHEGLNGVNR